MEKKYLTPREVADRYNISINTLRKWRSEKRGFPFIKIGIDKNNTNPNSRQGTILYPVDQIEANLNKEYYNVG